MAERDDILVGTAAAETLKPLRVRVAAFVPITIAMLGVGAILLGGVSARHDKTAAMATVDDMATGSIAKD